MIGSDGCEWSSAIDWTIWTVDWSDGWVVDADIGDVVWSGNYDCKRSYWWVSDEEYVVIAVVSIGTCVLGGVDSDGIESAGV